jgi:hypothetical protein
MGPGVTNATTPTLKSPQKNAQNGVLCRGVAVHQTLVHDPIIGSKVGHGHGHDGGARSADGQTRSRGTTRLKSRRDHLSSRSGIFQSAAKIVEIVAFL